MKFSEAIVQVAAIYSPGAVQYWASQPKDLWAEMLDGVEALLKSPDPDTREAAADLYVSRARELLDAFRASGKAVGAPQPIDAFLMGPGGAFRASESRRKKHCYRCQSKEKLSIEACGPEQLQVRLVCEQCKRTRRT